MPGIVPQLFENDTVHPPMSADAAPTSAGPLDQSLQGLQSHLQAWVEGQAPGKAPADADIDPKLGARSYPVRDLHRIADYWRPAALNNAGRVRETAEDTRIPGPETLAGEARRLDLEVEIRAARVSRLDKRNLPCSVLLRDGSSRLVIGVRKWKRYALLGADGLIEEIEAGALAAAATGTIFVFRQTAACEADAQHAKKSGPLSLRSLLIDALRGRKAMLASLVCAGLVSNCVSLALPLFTMTVFDRVVPHSAFETLWALALGIFGLLLIDLAVRHAKLKITDAIGLAAGTSLGAKIYGKLVRAPVKSVPKTAGAAVQPFNDVGAAGQLAPQFAAALLSDIPFFAVVIALLAMLGGAIAVIPIVAMVVLFALQAITHRLSMSATGEDARLSQRQTQMIIETVGAIETLKAGCAEAQFLGNWERRADAAAFAGHRLRVSHAVVAHISAFVSQAVVVLTVVIGVYQVSAASMSIGALSASMLLVGRVIQPISSLMGQYFRLLQIEETTRGLVALAGAQAEAGSDAHAPGKAGLSAKLELRKISFAYPGNAVPVLQEVTLQIAPGERVGIVGRAGCGKSSLLRLLIRLQEPTSGDIVLDGRDMRQFDPVEIRRAVALMTQDTVLIDGTLHDNLTLGLGEISQEYHDFVCGLSGVSDIAHRHPSGFSLAVGPGGRSLSGGERQAVALARALMGRPKLLLLDEPTSAMDNDRETRVIASLAKLNPQVGMIIATHRLPALSLVDRVIFMEAGRVVADGPKDKVFQQLGVKSA